MKKIFLILMALNSFTALGNPLGGNPTDGYCQTVDGSACGWGGGSSSSRRVYKVPNRWGAIYVNPANAAIVPPIKKLWQIALKLEEGRILLPAMAKVVVG